jgi:hypothetical protein
MEDTDHPAVPGSRDIAAVLSTDPLAALLGARLAHPVVLGCVLFAIAIAAIVLGPSSESRFIYTDF